MLAMGFTNEEEWLTNLLMLIQNGEDVLEVLEIFHASNALLNGMHKAFLSLLSIDHLYFCVKYLHKIKILC